MGMPSTRSCSGAGANELWEESRQGRLAGADAPDNTQCPAGLHFDRDVVEHSVIVNVRVACATELDIAPQLECVIFTSGFRRLAKDCFDATERGGGALKLVDESAEQSHGRTHLYEVGIESHEGAEAERSLDDPEPSQPEDEDEGEAVHQKSEGEEEAADVDEAAIALHIVPVEL